MEEAFNKRRVLAAGLMGKLFIKPCRRGGKRVVSQQDELQSCSSFLAAAVTISRHPRHFWASP
jgi:hypothetical protein